MRWIAWFILAYVALGVQLGLGGYVRVGDASPNLVLLAVIFIAVNAPRDAALLGCFCMGAMQDLVTQQPLGLYALGYGLIAMFVVSTQTLVYKKHPLTHFSLGLVAGLMVAAVLLVHGWVRPPAPAMLTDTGAALPAMRLSPVLLFKNALYTAVLAPFVLGFLQRLARIFSFEPSRRRLRSF